jgi:hypothetical protein
VVGTLPLWHIDAVKWAGASIPLLTDEVGSIGALLMGQDGAFVTGSDFLMDGGVSASYWYGELATK